VRENDGRKLDHKTLETLRLRAVDLVQLGAHPEQVALALGLHRKTVYGWLARYRDGGRGALLARPVPGRPPRLKPLHMRRLWNLIVGTDPRQLQFEFALWTREMVRELIRREFGVGLSAVSVGRLLAKMGLSPQRPVWRAYQQDPEAVRRWQEEDYPSIAAQAAAEGATIWFADEAGIRSDHHAGTTCSPVGQTPVVKVTGARFSVNMISAVTGKGALRFAVFEGTTTAKSFIEFCKRLVHDAPGPVCLIVDGHPSHRARAVKDYAASTGGRLRLFYLPGYSPELNPDEWVWKNVKNDRIARAGVISKDDLKAKAIGALRRLQKLPALVRGFFADPRLRYITACDFQRCLTVNLQR
jgi:transposase